MKRLVIFRHAKAVPHEAAPDFDRALNKRGRADAAATGRYLAAEHILPDEALVSPSIRTRETWEEAARSLPDTQVRFDPAVYDASVGALMAAIRRTDRSVRTLVLVGHNPGQGELALSLVGHGDRYAYSRMRQGFPTAAVAVIDFDIEDWADIAPNSGRLDRFVPPEHGED
jgi:phosphohistidine phosphatase